MSILLNHLDEAKPILWKTKINYCPPDCGGKDCDEIDYVPICPSCGYEFGCLDHDNFCRKCGTKLWWKVKHPEIIEN